MEQDHSLRRREEAKRIRLEQERDHVKFMEQLKQMKKEVNAVGWRNRGLLHLFLPGKHQPFSIADLEGEAVGVLAGSSCFFFGIFVFFFLRFCCLATLGWVFLGLNYLLINLLPLSKGQE